MKRTKQIENNIILKGIRRSMISHVQSFNRMLSYSHLNSLTYEELLNNCHPTERNGYARLLNKEGILSDSQLKEYSVQKM